MSTRLGTRIGLPDPEERPAGALDVVRFREPELGSDARTKGSLFLLAQITGADPALGRAAREALEALERDYYYDLSAGALGALTNALRIANRRLFHQRAKLGIPRRGGISIIALVVRARQAHIAKLGPAAAVIVRDGRMFELPPPPAVDEEDPRVRQRRVAATLGEALEIEPYAWQGDLAAGDILALVSRNLAQMAGVEELKHAFATLRPAAAIEHLQHLFEIRGGHGSEGVLAVEIVELPATATTHRLEPVRAAEPLAGLPDQSPVPLADALGHGLHRIADAIDGAQAALGQALLYAFNVVLAFVPRRRPEYPRQVLRTAVVEEGRRRRFGLLGMVVVALVFAFGWSVARLPSVPPTIAIPRAQVAASAIAQAQDLVAQVGQTQGGNDLIARAPDRAKQLLNDAYVALGQATDAGVAASDLEPLRVRVDAGLDEIYAVTRISEVTTVVDLSSAFEDVVPLDMAVATDGSLWVADTGRGRVIHVDPATGAATVVYHAGQALSGGTGGAPWMIATAATDVVLIDRQHQAWRFDLGEQTPRALALPGLDAVGSASHLLAALQHRPPLEIFNLYLVDGDSGTIDKWSPDARYVPVVYPSAPTSFLTDAPDIPVVDARDLLVDANLWLLQRNTLTRVNFGRPLAQADYRLDPPPDAEVRPDLDYRLLDGATIGDREMFYVWDAANARILGYQRADGSFVRQWLAPRRGAESGLLDDVLAMSVASVADGPPVAYLLTPDRVVRVVLE